MDTERMFIYRTGYTKWYTLQTCLSNTQSFHKFENEEENRVIEKNMPILYRRILKLQKDGL